jgi:hypothetical protein
LLGRGKDPAPQLASALLGRGKDPAPQLASALLGRGKDPAPQLASAFLGCRNDPALFIEAAPAKHRPARAGLERHMGRRAALRTDRLEHPTLSSSTRGHAVELHARCALCDRLGIAKRR